MARAEGNDLAEIFGYRPDDISEQARRQWKSQRCPFVDIPCIKHSHPRNGHLIVYGTCSVVNKLRNGRKEELIICPQRLYAEDYKVLKSCMYDAVGYEIPVYTADDYSTRKREGVLPERCCVMFGQNSGREVRVERRGVVTLNFDWVLVQVVRGQPALAVPCEVQSADITGNYQDTWEAYARELDTIPDSHHGMNWANVWKRLIPQLMLKGAVASTSKLCTKGLYFVVPERVFIQFEKILGKVPEVHRPGQGVLTVMTYELGPELTDGSIRELKLCRVKRMKLEDFAQSFASGKQLPLGTQLDEKVSRMLEML